MGARPFVRKSANPFDMSSPGSAPGEVRLEFHLQAVSQVFRRSRLLPRSLGYERPAGLSDPRERGTPNGKAGGLCPGCSHTDQSWYDHGRPRIKGTDGRP